MRASLEFRAYLDELIADARAYRAGGVIRDPRARAACWNGRREAMPQSADSWIRDNLLWCVAGVIDNVNAAVCRVIDRWLDDAELLEATTAAVREHDMARLQAFVFETLRFHTSTPVVIRRSVRAHTLGEGRRQKRMIPADTMVFVGLGTAMMVIPAPSTVPAPSASIARTSTTCISAPACTTASARHMAVAMVTEMVAALLRMPHLRRAAGFDGRLRSVGPFPTTFILDLPPAPDPPMPPASVVDAFIEAGSASLEVSHMAGGLEEAEDPAGASAVVAATIHAAAVFGDDSIVAACLVAVFLRRPPCPAGFEAGTRHVLVLLALPAYRLCQVRRLPPRGDAVARRRCVGTYRSSRDASFADPGVRECALRCRGRGARRGADAPAARTRRRPQRRRGAYHAPERAPT